MSAPEEAAIGGEEFVFAQGPIEYRSAKRW
jgi:hypothetical protein